MRVHPPTPLLSAAACLALGSLIEDRFGSWTGEWFWHLLVITSISGAFLFLQRNSGCSVTIVLLLASLSSSNASFQAKYGHNHVKWRLERIGDGHPNVTIQGRIVSDPHWKNGRPSMKVDIDCMILRLECLPVSGVLRVTLNNIDGPIGEGDRITVQGILQSPPRRRNPADFDVASWFASNHISGSLSRSRIIERIPSKNFLQRVVQSIRYSVRASIDRVVPERSRDLSLALLIGDRSTLAGPTRLDFARSGLMHLLAISGLHVMFVGMMVYRLMGPILTRLGCSWQLVEVTRSMATLTLLVVYALVCGSSDSVVRAVIMAGFLLAGTVTRKVNNPLNALGGAACVILMLDPQAVFQAGFQLSFSAVLGLLLFGNTLNKTFSRMTSGRLRSRLLASVGTSLVATLSTAPALIFHFGYVGLAGIVLNVVAIPIGAGLLCTSIITCIVDSLSSILAAPFGITVDLLSRSLKYAARLGGSSATLVLSTSDALFFGVTTVLVIAAISTKERGAISRWTILAAIATPCIGQFYTLASGREVPHMDVLFLDVGHGDAAIIRLPTGQALLIDAGNRHSFRDEGLSTVLPNLDKMDVDTVKIAVVSHPHADHLGGLSSLLRRDLVQCVADNGTSTDTHLYRDTRALIESKDLCYTPLSAGNTLHLGPMLRALVLGPTALARTSDTNDRSVVLKIIFGQTSVLFTGDIEREAEDLLTNQYCPLLKSNIVKMPHHGSKTSSTSSLIDCVSNREKSTRVILSVGSPEKYGLPDEEVIERWESAGIPVHSTFKDGALWVRSDGTNIREITWD